MSRVVHFEIQAQDMDAMEHFYSELFGWKFQKMGEELGGYRVIMTGDDPIGINGGMMQRNSPMPKQGEGVNAFTCIVGVEDVDAKHAKAIELGGIDAMAPMDVPTVGRIAYCKDPDGNIFGMITPDPASMPNNA